MEALACGTPVIGSNRGAIHEVLNNEVGLIIEPITENLKDAILFLYENRSEYERRKRIAGGMPRKSLV